MQPHQYYKESTHQQDLFKVGSDSMAIEFTAQVTIQPRVQAQLDKFNTNIYLIKTIASQFTAQATAYLSNEESRVTDAAGRINLQDLPFSRRKIKMVQTPVTK